MTTIGVTLGGSDFSDYVFSADTWRDTLAGVGRWEVLMDPLANYWPWNLPFTPDNAVTITINGSVMMMGYIDDVEPYLEGLETDIWKLSGRDYGLDLAERFYTSPRGDYVNVRADDIINRAFTAVGTEITPPAAPFTAPFINYEWKRRTKLGDAVRDICEKIGYDFYVQDNVARTLHFFAQGAAAEHTGIDLTMIPNSLTNNILPDGFEMGERLGSKIKNYLIASAGSLKDHYTDLNANDWAPNFQTAVNDYYPPGLTFLEGKASLQVLSQANNHAVTITLDFTPGLYGYTSIDMSEPCTGYYTYLCHYPNYYSGGAGIRRCHLALIDTNGTEIRFYRTLTLGFARNNDATQTGFDDEWQIVKGIPFGEQNIENVLVGANTKGFWYYFAGPPPPTFNWEQVQKISFSSGNFPIDAHDFFLVDALSIPSVEVISIAQNAASILAYGQRDEEEYRPDIRNQVELDNFAANLLPSLMEPLETLHIIAEGQTPSDYAGQSLDVRADNFGLPALTRYRITNLHHMVRRSSQESEVPGWNFMTEYHLIADDFHIGGTQPLNMQRYLDSSNALEGRLNRTRIQQNQRQQLRVNVG